MKTHKIAMNKSKLLQLIGILSKVFDAYFSLLTPESITAGVRRYSLNIKGIRTKKLEPLRPKDFSFFICQL